jgi:hypothetical protein
MSQKRECRQRVAAELEKLDFGDLRRAARGLLVGERLAHQPKVSLPAAMRDEAELEGAYRHLTSPAVTLGNVAPCVRIGGLRSSASPPPSRKGFASFAVALRQSRPLD